MNINKLDSNNTPLSKEIEVPSKKDDLVIILKNSIDPKNQYILLNLQDKLMTNLPLEGLSISNLVDKSHMAKGYKYVTALEHRNIKHRFNETDTKLLCQQIENFRSDELRGKLFIINFIKHVDNSEAVVSKMNKHFSSQDKIIKAITGHKVPHWFAKMLVPSSPLFQQVNKALSERGLINDDTTQPQFLLTVLENKLNIEDFFAEGCKHVTLKEWEGITSKYNEFDARRLCEYIDQAREYKVLSEQMKFGSEKEKKSHKKYVYAKEKISEAIIHQKIPKWFPKLLETDKVFLEQVKIKLIDLKLADKDSLETDILSIVIDKKDVLNDFVKGLLTKDKITPKLPRSIIQKEIRKEEVIERNIHMPIKPEIEGKEESIKKLKTLDKKKLMVYEALKKYKNIKSNEFLQLYNKFGKNEELLEKVCIFINQAKENKFETNKNIKNSFKSESFDAPLSPPLLRKNTKDGEDTKDLMANVKIMEFNKAVVNFIFRGEVPQWFQRALDPNDIFYKTVKQALIEEGKISPSAKDIEVLNVMLKNSKHVEDFIAVGYKHVKVGELEKIYQGYDPDKSKKIAEWIDVQRENINLKKNKKTQTQNSNILTVALLHKNVPTWLVDAFGGDNILFENIKNWLVSHKLANENNSEVDILTAALENKDEINKEVKKLNSVKGLRKVNQIIQRENQDIKGRIDPLRDKVIKDWVIVGQKPSGIEPGFVAKKRGWSEKHIQKILNNEKYMSRAIHWAREKYKPLTDNKSDEDLKVVVKSLLRNPNHPDFAELMQAVRTKYIFKMNYADPSPGTEYVQTDLDRVNSTTVFHLIPGISTVAKSVHSNTTSDTIKNKNLAAVIECFSNDVYRALGFRSQDLYIVPDKYSDGKSKLMLAAKYISGEKGEAFQTFEKSMENGHLKENQVVDPLTGKMVPINPHGLAQLKLLMLLMGDHDKIGISGGNVGYVVENGRAEIINIDPGKSLESAPAFSQEHVQKSSGLQWLLNVALFPVIGQTDKMTYKNIHEDFSYQDFSGSISNIAKGGYRNISICDDLSYVEQMQVLREIREKFHLVEKICQQYKDQFGEEAGDLNFAKEISIAFERLSKRTEDFLNVFEKRINLSDDQLNMLEALEKLCSPTHSFWVDSKKEKINFQHLQIVPGKRVPWNYEGEKLICHASSPKEASQLLIKIQSYLKDKNIDEDISLMIKQEGNNIVINGPTETLANIFSPDGVKTYKNK